MPGFDGTGPLGQGPMTGRSRGFCVLTTSKENPDQIDGLVGIEGKPIRKIDGNLQFAGKKVISPWFRRGFGFGRGFGRGRGWGRGRGGGRFGFRW
jgi:hypothetical protein